MTLGAGTVASTWRMTSSVVTPSASASYERINAVAEHLRRDVEDVLRHEEATAAQHRERAAGGDQAERRARARTERRCAARAAGGRHVSGSRVVITMRTA